MHFCDYLRFEQADLNQHQPALTENIFHTDVTTQQRTNDSPKFADVLDPNPSTTASRGLQNSSHKNERDKSQKKNQLFTGSQTSNYFELFQLTE